MAKFLVVDDSDVFIDLLAYTLEDAGFANYDIAKNGKDGLEMASKNSYKLIITDVTIILYNFIQMQIYFVQGRCYFSSIVVT